jgi:hypothetical protein
MKKRTLPVLIFATIGVILFCYYLFSAKIDYDKIYSYCLDGDVKSAMTLLKLSDNKILSPKGWIIKNRFEKRFKNAEDESGYLKKRKSPITELLTIYRNYWRAALLDNSKNYDSTLIHNVTNLLIDKYPPAHNLIANEDSLDIYIKKYIESFGLHTTGFGKTGKFFDLLVWKSEKGKNYSLILDNEEKSTKVVSMDDFITLGWEEYSTLGRCYPGGWAGKNALYCVKNSYDLNSEQFKVSFLAHESRHFADYKLFPNLKSADLEYRAKLTELSMAQKTLYTIINDFIINANYNSENGHSIANYCVIRDLSKALFNVEFEKDIQKWKNLSIGKINKTADEVLLANTKSLQNLGGGVEKFIKQ